MSGSAVEGLSQCGALVASTGGGDATTAAAMIVAESLSSIPVPLGLALPLSLRGGDPEAQSRLHLGLGFCWQSQLLPSVHRAIRRSGDAASPWFTLPPLLVCGAAGVGRTHFARRLAQLAGLPHVGLDLSDPAGTEQLRQRPRGPDLVLPSLPVLAMAVSGCANPVISIAGLDGADLETQGELAKMIDPRTGARWVDFATRSTVDLRQISWIVQCRDPSMISPALLGLLSRVELHWPEPHELPLHLAEVLAEAAIDAGVIDRVEHRVAEGLIHLQRASGSRSTARLYESARHWVRTAIE